MSESFDPMAFLDSATTEALTRRPPLPIGDYIGVTGEIKASSWTSQKESAKVKSGIRLDIPVTIDLSVYPEAQSVVGDLPSIQLTAGVMIDSKDGDPNQGIDWGVGKNGALRRWREALDMNTPGQPFSIRQMSGRMVRVKIGHRPYEGEFYDEIASVSKA